MPASIPCGSLGEAGWLRNLWVIEGLWSVSQGPAPGVTQSSSSFLSNPGKPGQLSHLPTQISGLQT